MRFYAGMESEQKPNFKTGRNLLLCELGHWDIDIQCLDDRQVTYSKLILSHVLHTVKQSLWQPDSVQPRSLINIAHPKVWLGGAL